MSLVRDKHITYDIADGDGDAAITLGTASTTYTLNGASVVGGIAVFALPRHVLITASGNESSNTFTVVGTDVQGNSLTEAIVGPNASTATGTRNFKTITSITQSATNTGGVEIGTADTMELPWIPLDYRTPHSVSVAVNVVSGTLGFKVEKTYEDPQSFRATTASTIYATDVLASGGVDTSTALGDSVPTAIRLNVLSLSSAAVLRLDITQA